MEPETTTVWTPAEVRAAVGKILVDSLGVDDAAVTDKAALVRDLGAESIDFLDVSFKCQQTFGVDLPARLIQERILEWRGLGVLASVIQERYGVPVAAEELRTIAPSTVSATLAHLHARHGVARASGDEQGLALVLAERLMGELDGMALDLADVKPEPLAAHLLENLHSPAAVEELLNCFTVRALSDYLAARLAAASRLATGA